MNEIQEIHTAFEFDILTALTNDAADTRVEQFRPAGVNPDEFNRAVAEYRMTYPQNNFITERQIIYETIIHGSPWLVEFGVGSLQYGSVVYSWQQAFDRFEFRPGIGQTTVTKSRANVSLRLTLDQIQRANVLDLSINVSPIVVAPRSMFTRFGDAVEVSGHRVKFRASDTINNASFRWVDDPIVLQPVPFGYLVVTKWGAESRIPEIQSPVEN